MLDSSSLFKPLEDMVTIIALGGLALGVYVLFKLFKDPDGNGGRRIRPKVIYPSNYTRQPNADMECISYVNQQSPTIRFKEDTAIVNVTFLTPYKRAKVFPKFFSILLCIVFCIAT